MANITTEEIVKALGEYKNGQFLSVSFRKVLEAKKGVTDVAVKTTQVIVRKGLDYTNLKSTKEAVENGKELTHELPWGVWKEGLEGLVISHKGNDYVRLYISGVPTTEYTMNGVPTTKEAVKASGKFLSKNFPNNPEATETITVKVSNITEIAHKSVA